MDPMLDILYIPGVPFLNTTPDISFVKLDFLQRFKSVYDTISKGSSEKVKSFINQFLAIDLGGSVINQNGVKKTP